MQKILLDTDVLSEILKGKNDPVLRHAQRYAESVGVFTFTAVSVLEIAYGLNSKAATQQLQAAELAFEANEVIVPILEDYELAGMVRGLGRRQGNQLATEDCLIGVVAHRLQLPLATGNVAHFDAMKSAGLDFDLIDWHQF